MQFNSSKCESVDNIVGNMENSDKKLPSELQSEFADTKKEFNMDICSLFPTTTTTANTNSNVNNTQMNLLPSVIAKNTLKFSKTDAYQPSKTLNFNIDDSINDPLLCWILENNLPHNFYLSLITKGYTNLEFFMIENCTIADMEEILNECSITKHSLRLRIKIAINHLRKNGTQIKSKNTPLPSSAAVLFPHALSTICSSLKNDHKNITVNDEIDNDFSSTNLSIVNMLDSVGIPLLPNVFNSSSSISSTSNDTNHKQEYKLPALPNFDLHEKPVLYPEIPPFLATDSNVIDTTAVNDFLKLPSISVFEQSINNLQKECSQIDGNFAKQHSMIADRFYELHEYLVIRRQQLITEMEANAKNSKNKVNIKLATLKSQFLSSKTVLNV